MHDWFLVQFKPNAHRVAERNLNQQGFNTFLPVEEITVRMGSKFRNVLKPLFPGYMFTGVDPAKKPWRQLNSTSGVSRIVCHNGIPKTVPVGLVMGLMSRCDNFGKLLPENTVSTGDTVEFLTGTFTNFIGTVENIDKEQRIWVMMEIMGQTSRVEISHARLKLSST